MNESIGDKIINAVISGGLFQAHDADAKPIEQPLIYIWSSGAAEQLEAVVEAHVQEEVRKRVYIEMALKKNLDSVADSVTDKDRKTIQDYIDTKYPDVAPPYPETP